MYQDPGTPTVALCLSNLTAADTSESELDDVLEDVHEEAGNSGAVETSLIVRASNLSAAQAARPGSVVGDVMVKFGAVDSAQKCCAALNGRLFAGNQVKATFVDPAVYEQIKTASK